MKSALLDTHVFLWALSDPDQLSMKADQFLSDENTEIFFSMASIWEIGIKISLKKLTLQFALNDLIQAGIRDLGIKILPIELTHVEAVATLPFHHRDPFDRMLIAQSKVNRLSILGADTNFDSYGIRRIW